MWQQIFLCFLGLVSGTLIAGGIVGLLVGLAIIPRYAGITHTSNHILLYEDMTMLGTIFGTVFMIFSLPLPLGNPFLMICGFFFGIFLGGWILALAEVADIFPIFSRRIRLKEGIAFIILSIAIGKCSGSFLFFINQW